MSYQAAAIDIIEYNDPTTLTDIYEPSVNLAVWQREFDEHLLSFAKQMSQQQPTFQARWIGKFQSIANQLDSSLPAYHGRSVFLEDITLLMEMFSELFGLQEIGVRLAVLTKTMCPKFHVDHVPCRLMSTYSGSTTEWISNEYVERSQAKGVVVRDKQHVQHLQFGDVALMKGEAWEGNEGKGLVHRSPAASAESPRLVLTIDFA